MCHVLQVIMDYAGPSVDKMPDYNGSIQNWWIHRLVLWLTLMEPVQEPELIWWEKALSVMLHICAFKIKRLHIRIISPV